MATPHDDDLATVLAHEDDLEERELLDPDDRRTCHPHQEWYDRCWPSPLHANRVTGHNWCRSCDQPIAECPHRPTGPTKASVTGSGWFTPISSGPQWARVGSGRNALGPWHRHSDTPGSNSHNTVTITVRRACGGHDTYTGVSLQLYLTNITRPGVPGNCRGQCPERHLIVSVTAELE